jgi:hypothetical protein
MPPRLPLTPQCRKPSSRRHTGPLDETGRRVLGPRVLRRCHVLLAPVHLGDCIPAAPSSTSFGVVLSRPARALSQSSTQQLLINMMDIVPDLVVAISWGDADACGGHTARWGRARPLREVTDDMRDSEARWFMSCSKSECVAVAPVRAGRLARMFADGPIRNLGTNSR